MAKDQAYCPRCRQHKAASEWHSSPSNSAYCITCTRAYQRARYSPAQQRDRDLQSNYGITAVEYDKLLDAQHGVCAACSRPETQYSNRAGRVKYLAVDHDHATDAVRGLLCQDCNQALGLLASDHARIRMLLAYAEQHC